MFLNDILNFKVPMCDNFRTRKILKKKIRLQDFAIIYNKIFSIETLVFKMRKSKRKKKTPCETWTDNFYEIRNAQYVKEIPIIHFLNTPLTAVFQCFIFIMYRGQIMSDSILQRWCYSLYKTGVFCLTDHCTQPLLNIRRKWIWTVK